MLKIKHKGTFILLAHFITIKSRADTLDNSEFVWLTFNITGVTYGIFFLLVIASVRQYYIETLVKSDS